MTRRRRRARGPSPPALFTWRPDGDTTPGEARVNPLSVRCPWAACHAPEGQPCTTREPHPSRRDAAEAAAHKPTETPPSAAVAERTERS